MKDKIKDFIMWAISEGHMEYDELLAMPENINADEDVADRLVEMYFDVVPEPIQEEKCNCWTDRMTTTSTWNEDAGCLICDNCGKKEL